jgi:hypothetical protein
MTIQTNAPPVTRHELLERDSDEIFTVTGRLIGYGSSETTQHSHEGDYVAGKQRCSACRWFEVRIIEVESVITEFTSSDEHLDPFITAPPARYLVHTVGRTEIPSERQYVRVEWCDGGPTIINALTVRKRRPDGSPDVFIAGPSHKALSLAAQHDDDIRDAYADRAVA